MQRHTRTLDLDDDKLAALLTATLNGVAPHDPDRAAEFVALLASRRLALDVDESDDVVTIYATPASQATRRIPILDAPRAALVSGPAG